MLWPSNYVHVHLRILQFAPPGAVTTVQYKNVVKFFCLKGCIRQVPVKYIYWWMPWTHPYAPSLIPLHFTCTSYRKQAS